MFNPGHKCVLNFIKTTARFYQQNDMKLVVVDVGKALVFFFFAKILFAVS